MVTRIPPGRPGPQWAKDADARDAAAREVAERVARQTVARLVPTFPDAEKAAGYRHRLNQALALCVQPIIAELEADGFVAHFTTVKDERGVSFVQVASIAKHF